MKTKKIKQALVKPKQFIDFEEFNNAQYIGLNNGAVVGIGDPYPWVTKGKPDKLVLEIRAMFVADSTVHAVVKMKDVIKPGVVDEKSHEVLETPVYGQPYWQQVTFGTVVSVFWADDA